jgi:N-acetyl-gamma-glutamyl-phosphate reductase
MGSLSSYKFGGAHQHTPEIEQALSKVAGKSVTLNFTPILAPMPRGILTTISARLSAAALEHSDEYIYEIYREFFGDEFFVKVLPVGMMPNTNAVNGSNFVHLQVAVDRHAGRVCISVAIDNLGKGAASQAVQNANLLFALPESTGLTITGVRP